MKKLFFVMCAFVLAITPLLANGSDESDVAVQGAETLTMWSYMGGEEAKSLQIYVDEYNQSQNRYFVEIEYVPFGDMKKKYSIGIVSKELPDLAMVDNPDMAAFASIGLFEDITDKVASWGEAGNYFPGPLNSTILDGRNYGLPITSNCLAMFYNKDIFDEAGLAVPETWDELLTVGKRLSGEGIYALALSAVKTEEGVFQFLPWYLSTGASVESPNSPEGIKALEFYKTLVDEGIMSPEVINWSQGDAQKQFSLGKAAMMINGPWNINSVRKDSPDMNWGTAMIPKDKKFASVLGGENLGIVKGANVEGAWDFMKFFSSKDVVNRFISKTGYFPPRKDVAEENERWKENPILKVFLEEMQFAMPRGPHPKWPQISAALAEGVQKGLVGTVSPAQAMAQTQTKINDAIK